MAESGSQIALKFVPILWISQPCPNRGYSQYICSQLIYGFSKCPEQNLMKLRGSVYPSIYF